MTEREFVSTLLEKKKVFLLHMHIQKKSLSIAYAC